MYSNDMKYIVTAVNHPGRTKPTEHIFIFPKFINHDNFAETLRRCQDRSDYCNPSRISFEVVAAGFTNGEQCWGRSETLRLDSRGKDDANLIPHVKGGDE